MSSKPSVWNHEKQAPLALKIKYENTKLTNSQQGDLSKHLALSELGEYLQNKYFDGLVPRNIRIETLYQKQVKERLAIQERFFSIRMVSSLSDRYESSAFHRSNLELLKFFVG